MTKRRTYTELSRLHSFEEKFEYLALRGQVGESTFGYDRYINQAFYRSAQWRRVRRDVIARDEGCDLGVAGFEIYDKVIIHHMNPMTVNEVVEGEAQILDPEFLISVTLKTHNAIHYGDASLLQVKMEPRRPGDTALWTRR